MERKSIEDKIPEATIYGPIVQGKRKIVTKIPTKKAPLGPVIFETNLFIVGLIERGISVKAPPGL